MVKNQNLLGGLAEHKPSGDSLYEASECVFELPQKDLKLLIGLQNLRPFMVIS